jgi:2-polyprenyl-3-methyl-5-hydroxy-6-metoxy-1,4-benzoquinol methylase
MATAAPAPHVVEFYDDHITHKVADFVDGNHRVEAAWRTIKRCAPDDPREIAEIGCGLGTMAHRMAECWPAARVTGADISPRSIAYAARLFERPNLRYVNGRTESLGLDGRCDLVVLVDVFEHIERSERQPFLDAIGALLAPDSRLILTFPTPAYQRLLRDCSPEKLQPVDEDVDAAALQQVAAVTRTELVMFEEQNIWLTGDYAHAVFARRETGRPVIRRAPAPPAPLARAVRKVRSLFHGSDPDSRAARLELVERTLGRHAYRPR